MSLHLLIKTPNQKVPDQSVECGSEWTVRTLKAYLSQVYPTKPNVEDQKLIYSGRLLHDHLALKDVFRMDEGETRVLHLVCMQSSQDTASEDTESNQSHSLSSTQNSSTSASLTSTTQMASNSTPASSAFSPDGLRQRTVPQESPRVSQPLALPVQTGGPISPYQITPEQMAHQMAAMQQFYAQYFSLYSQYLGGQAGIVPSIQPGATSVPLAAGANINAANQNPPVPDRPVAEVNRMNVQGGPVPDDDDDELRNRDWLDWFHMFTRALLLFSIVVFHSSVGRLMVVTGLGILMYLYQTGFFGFGRRQQAEAIPQNAPNRNNGEAGGADQANRHQSPEEQRANARAAHPPRNREVQSAEEIEAMMDGNIDPNPIPERPSPLRTAWTIITALFTSLIPEQPPPLNIN